MAARLSLSHPPTPVPEARVQSRGEQLANSLTHGLGLLFSVVALPILLAAASGSGDAWRVGAAAVYGTTLVLLYGASTIYHGALARFHAAPNARVETVLQRLDHAAIFLLIAGTYTPFVLVPLRGPWGWSLFGVVWGLALIGVALKTLFGARQRTLSTVVYVLMGWLMVIAIGPLAAQVGPAGLGWLFAGGLLYTGGVAFYAWDRRLRYGHALWHLCVLGGSVSHFCAVLWYALPVRA